MDYKDKLLILLSAVLVSVSGYMFTKVRLPSLEGDRGEQLALIQNFSNVVKKRNAGSLAWLDTFQGQKLYNEDQVFTHSESHVVIEFLDASTLELLPNTLLKIGKSSEGIDLGLLKGFFSLNLKSDKQKINLRLGKKRVSIRSRGAKLHISANQLVKRVVLIQGDATVKEYNSKKVIKLKKGAAISVKKGKPKIEITKISILPKTPPMGKTTYFVDIPEVNFSWEVNQVGEEEHLLISKTASFNKIFKKINLKKLAISATDRKFKLSNLSAGTFYWQIRVKVQGKTTTGPVFNFHLKKDRSPQLYYPEQNQTTIISKLVTDYKVDFRWKKMVVAGYQVEIRRGQGKSRVVDLKKNSLSMRDIRFADYSWRVRVLDKRRPNSPWSNYRYFRITKKIPPIEILSPIAGHIFNLGVDPSPILFTWKGGDIRFPYKLILARDENFKKKHLTKEIKGTQFTWVRPQLGKYYWKIIAKEQSSLGVQQGYFEVFVRLASLLVPVRSKEIILYERGQKIKFSWKGLLPDYLRDKNRKKQKIKYYLEVASTSDFSKIVYKKSIAKNSLFWSPLNTGKYYWRVRVRIGGTKDNYSAPSEVFSFVTVKPPTALPPKMKKSYEMEFEESNGDGEVSPNSDTDATSLVGPSRSIASKSDKYYVNLKWKAVKHSKKYKIEIYKDQKMSEKIFEKIIKHPKFRWYWNESGMFYFRIASIDGWNRQGFFSPLSKMTLIPNKKLRIRAKLLSPKHKKEFRAKIKNITFKWGKVKHARKYVFSIWRDVKMSEVVFKKKLSRKKRKLVMERSAIGNAGRYFWKVDTIFVGEKVKGSKLRRFDIMGPPSPPPVKEEKEEGKVVAVKYELFNYVPNYASFTWIPSQVKYDAVKSGTKVTYTNAHWITTRLTGWKGFKRKFFVWGDAEYTSAKISATKVVYSELSFKAIGGMVAHTNAKFLITVGVGVKNSSVTVSTLNSVGTTFTDESLNLITPTLHSRIYYNRAAKYSHFADVEIGALGMTTIALAYTLHIRSAKYKNWFFDLGGNIILKGFDAKSIDADIQQSGILLGVGNNF